VMCESVWSAFDVKADCELCGQKPSREAHEKT
jgi:hypothetical protein